MRKSLYFFLTLTLLFLGTSKAKAADSLSANHAYPNAVGLHLGIGFGNIFSGGSNDLFPYRFTYRRYFGENAFRAGLGAGFDREIDVFNGEAELQTIQDGFYSFRVGLGYERYHAFNDRFKLYYGGEINNFYRRDISKEKSLTQHNERIDHDYQIGIAPIVGLEVRITDRFSVSAEGMWNFGFQFARTETQSTTGAGTSFNTYKSSNQFRDFELPSGVTFRYNF